MADEILAKYWLTQLDVITLQIKLLQNSVDKINATVSALENEVALELQLLNYEVYQRRKNLRFYRIREEGTDENTKETLYNFFETELGIEDARRIEFQRVHRVGKEKRNPRKPRAIIARFLRYPDREAVLSRRSSLEDESGFGIGPDLPKQVVEMRKKLIPKMLEARKQGKRAAFNRSEPYKLLIDGLQCT